MCQCIIRRKKLFFRLLQRRTLFFSSPVATTMREKSAWDSSSSLIVVGSTEDKKCDWSYKKIIFLVPPAWERNWCVSVLSFWMCWKKRYDLVLRSSENKFIFFFWSETVREELVWESILPRNLVEPSVDSIAAAWNFQRMSPSNLRSLLSPTKLERTSNSIKSIKLGELLCAVAWMVRTVLVKDTNSIM